MASTEFLITLTYGPRGITLSCAGELDIATAGKLRDAIDICIEDGPRLLTLDAQGISMLTSSGIEVLIHTIKACRKRDIELRLLLSRPARRILDLVGLWWLGVVDDGPAIDEAFRDAMRAYSKLHFEGRFKDSEVA